MEVTESIKRKNESDNEETPSKRTVKREEPKFWTDYAFLKGCIKSRDLVYPNNAGEVSFYLVKSPLEVFQVRSCQIGSEEQVWTEDLFHVVPHIWIGEKTLWSPNFPYRSDEERDADHKAKRRHIIVEREPGSVFSINDLVQQGKYRSITRKEAEREVERICANWDYVPSGEDRNTLFRGHDLKLLMSTGMAKIILIKPEETKDTLKEWEQNEAI